MFTNINTDRVKIYVFITSVVLLTATCAVFALTPSVEDVLQDELKAIGQDWDQWEKIEQEARERQIEASEKKVELHVRAEAIRSAFQ